MYPGFCLPQGQLNSADPSSTSQTALLTCPFLLFLLLTSYLIFYPPSPSLCLSACLLALLVFFFFCIQEAKDRPSPFPTLHVYLRRDCRWEKEASLAHGARGRRDESARWQADSHNNPTLPPLSLTDMGFLRQTATHWDVSKHQYVIPLFRFQNVNYAVVFVQI